MSLLFSLLRITKVIAFKRIECNKATEDRLLILFNHVIVVGTMENVFQLTMEKMTIAIND